MTLQILQFVVKDMKEILNLDCKKWRIALHLKGKKFLNCETMDYRLHIHKLTNTLNSTKLLAEFLTERKKNMTVT